MSSTYAAYCHHQFDYRQPQFDHHPSQPIYQPPHHPTGALDLQQSYPQDGNFHPQHHPYQARKPTCWDPPWLRQTAAYQQPSSYEPDLYSPPPSSCWKPPWLRTQQGYSPYDQPPSSPPHSPSCWDPPAHPTVRQPTSWDLPSQHLSIEFQHLDQTPSHQLSSWVSPQTRQPPCWEPPLTAAVPQPPQPRQLSCGPPTSPHHSATALLHFAAAVPPPVAISPPCSHDVSGEEEDLFEDASPLPAGIPPPCSPNQVCVDEDKVLPHHLVFFQNYSNHTSIPIELVDAMKYEHLGEGNDKIDIRDSARQPMSGQPRPATTEANSIVTQLERLLGACKRMESRLDAAYQRVDSLLPPELPEPAPPVSSQIFESRDLVQHHPPSGNSKALLGLSGLVPNDSSAPPQQSSTTPLFELPPYTAPGPVQPVQPLPMTAPLLASNRLQQFIVPSSRKTEGEMNRHDEKEKLCQSRRHINETKEKLIELNGTQRRWRENGNDDKNLPQVSSLLLLLKLGIGVHRSGLLAIRMEVMEILFHEGFIKFRWISIEEYIQMSRRAGHLGIDEGGRPAVQYTFDPGGGALPTLRLSTLLIASWIPP